ncbi:hypothetical protein [Microbulbifer aestuariivivens]|uniref:hypothetical protein n=1 Tax=Microbulbifer aestuariivivens TaxID=1908308 RepID=UPI0031ED4DFD
MSKGFLMSTAVVIGAPIALSVFANVAYIYTLCGLFAWATVGHLVTLDDDMPGEWSNMERSPEVWRKSKIELLAKFVVFCVLLAVMLRFPQLALYGA